MKILSLLFLVTLISCNGGGSAGGDEGDVAVEETPLEITYNSLGLFQNTGVSLDQMGVYDEQRDIVIPQFVDVLQDTSGSLQVGDKARIQFIYVACDYLYDGNQFVFNSCRDVLSTPTHAALATAIQFGDVIHLEDVREPSNPSMNGIIQFGVVRPSNNNHTGTIEIKASLF